MGRILFGVIAAVALFMLVQGVDGKPSAKHSMTKKPLTCNMCSYGLLGFCLSTSEETCSTNTSLCSTGKITFQGLSNVGFNTQGCHEPAGCNTTTNGTLLGVTYIKILECCSTDKCNPAQTSGAPSTKMTLTAAIGVAVLASVWGSIL